MSTTTHPTTAVPPALEVPGPVTRVPSLEEIARLTEVPDRRVVFRGVDWAYYERFLKVIGEGRGIRLTYDGKDLEIMSPGPLHEEIGKVAGDLVGVINKELEIGRRSLRSTTWERPEVERGIECDDCFYFQSEKLAQAAAARKRKSTTTLYWVLLLVLRDQKRWRFHSRRRSAAVASTEGHR